MAVDEDKDDVQPPQAPIVRQRSVSRRDGDDPCKKDDITDGENLKIKPENKGKRAQERGSKKSACYKVACLLVLFVVLAISLDSLLWWPSSSSFNANSNQSFPKLAKNNFTLRPEDHTNVEPNTIDLQWRISTGLRSPDGVSKLVYLINNEFMGPTIEAKSGDFINIDVVNELDGEGVAFHFHGLRMRGYNAMDGAVGITQDPIPAGHSFVYRFQIGKGEHGTYWYHAHSQVQRGDGLFGAFVVHRPRQEVYEHWAQYDEDRVLMINDWYHRSSEKALVWYLRSGSFGMEPVPDSILINGVGHFNCSDAVAARPVQCQPLDFTPIQFESSKSYRLRLINSGMLSGVTVALSGARLTVMEIDGGNAVTPSSAASIGILYPGQRVDLLVEWTSEVSTLEPTLTISLDKLAFRYPNPSLTTTQTFPVQLSGPITNNHGDNVEEHVDLLQLTSLSAVAFPAKPDLMLVLYTTTLKLARLSNVPHGFINHTTWIPQSPPLISLPRESYDSHQLVPHLPYNATEPTWIDIILNNLDDDDHPFHLHGYSPYILATHRSNFGWGSWNPFKADEPPGSPLELERSARRDTFMVPRRGYVVFRFRADSPGIWLFHCHVLWHLGSGMGMSFEVGESRSGID
jgi:FtsP/CotA-like multicopper oxidase with cupredoxin domain